MRAAKRKPSIFHSRKFGEDDTIRLNLKAVNALLDSPVQNFGEMTRELRDNLQLRFDAYCRRSKPRFGPGKHSRNDEQEGDIPPCLDNLPDKRALRAARKEVAL